MAERPLRPAGGRGDLLAIGGALAIVLATLLVTALAGGGPGREEPAAEAPPAASASPAANASSAVAPSVASAGPAGCAEWTDGCVVCQRTAGGPACSTPGIACTRGAISCLRR